MKSVNLINSSFARQRNQYYFRIPNQPDGSSGCRTLDLREDRNDSSRKTVTDC
jgi:hypothetical protein